MVMVMVVMMLMMLLLLVVVIMNMMMIMIISMAWILPDRRHIFDTSHARHIPVLERHVTFPPE